MGWRSRIVRMVAIAAVLAIAPARAAMAHVTTTQGPLRVTMGWGEEPAYSGSMNSIEVIVSRVDGAPVDSVGSLTVEVSSGSERLALPLVPGGPPGTYQARLVPTRAGTYAFHVTGAVAGDSIDTKSTCSERTFDCVTDVAEIQFPSQEPSGSQLASKLDRELRRAAASESDDTTARWLGIAAIALAGCALIIAVGRRAKKDRPST